MKLEVKTKVYQNLRETEIKKADARLGKKAALWAQEAELAKIQASKHNCGKKCGAMIREIKTRLSKIIVHISSEKIVNSRTMFSEHGFILSHIFKG